MALPNRRLSAREEAFRAIYLAECAYMCRTLERLGVHSSDLEDVALDLFLKFHEKLDDYDLERPVRPLLAAFAVRCAADYRKRAHIRHEAGADSELAADAPAARGVSWSSELDIQERRRAVLAGIDRIQNEDQRAVFVLHEINGFSIPDIVKMLGIPLNTAYSRLRTARETFRLAVLGEEDSQKNGGDQ